MDHVVGLITMTRAKPLVAALPIGDRETND